MNILQQRQYNRFQNVVEFLDNHSKDFSSGSRALTLGAELKEVVNTLKEGGQNPVAKKSGPRTYTSAKLDALNALRADIVKIANTARIIESHEENFKNTFEVPDKRRKEDLAKAARQFKADAAKSKELFQSWEMPENFLETLQEHIDTYEATQKSEGRGAGNKARSTTEIGAALERGNKLMESIDVALRNKYSGEELEAWKKASSLEKSTRRRGAKKDAE